MLTVKVVLIAVLAVTILNVAFAQSRRIRSAMRSMYFWLFPRAHRGWIEEGFDDYEAENRDLPLLFYVTNLISFWWHWCFSDPDHVFRIMLLPIAVLLTLVSEAYLHSPPSRWYCMVWLPAGLYMAVTVKWPFLGVLLAAMTGLVSGLVNPAHWWGMWILPNVCEALSVIALYRLLGCRRRILTHGECWQFAVILLLSSVLGGLFGATAATFHSCWTLTRLEGSAYQLFCRWSWADIVGTFVVAPILIAAYTALVNPRRCEA